MNDRTWLLTLVAGLWTWPVFAEAPTVQVTAPPADLKLHPFYKKHVDLNGFSIISSEEVPDEALLVARDYVSRMLTKRPDILEMLIKQRIRLVIMGRGEYTTDIPEHSDLKPKDYWDRRARGLGATRRRPIVSAAEENILKYASDRYRGENILIHEFAHAIHTMGLNRIDPAFDERLQSLYKNALAQGLWKNTYAATNRGEYFAEGVQCWFNANREASPPNGIHNHVNTRAELKLYDPRLYELLATIFPDDDWEDSRKQRLDPLIAPRPTFPLAP